jgi:chromosome segregation ATPase
MLTVEDLTQLRKDIKDEFKEFKEDIKTLINNGNSAIKESIADKLKPIEQTQERYRSDHEQHFKRINTAETERAEIKTDLVNVKLKQNDHEHEIKEIKKTVNGLDRRQTIDEGQNAGLEKANQKWYQKYGALLGLIGGIGGVLAIIFKLKG